jgi:hypothetical protein
VCFFLILGIVLIAFQYVVLTSTGEASAPEQRDSKITFKDNIFTKRSNEFSGKRRERTVIIDDLPASYDQTLLLRKGRRIPVLFGGGIQTRVHPYYQPSVIAHLAEDIRDDTGQFELLARETMLECLYQITKTGKQIKIRIVAKAMNFDLLTAHRVNLTNPPMYLNLEINTLRASISRYWALSVEEREEWHKDEWRQYEEMFFASPVMSAELILEIGSKDSHINWELAGENSSDDLEMSIRSGYRTELIVEKDILFSDYTDPYLTRPALRNWR